MEGINVEHLNDMRDNYNSRNKVKDVCLNPKIALAWRDLIKEIFLLQTHYTISLSFCYCDFVLIM